MAEAPGKYEPGGPIPSSPGRVADLYKEVEDLAREMQRETDVVKQRASELKEHLIQTLSKSDDTGAAGLRYRAQIKTVTKPKPTDWDAIYKFIVDNDRFDFLQKRLSDRAVMDMIEAGEKVPGVERIHIPTVSITKI